MRWNNWDKTAGLILTVQGVPAGGEQWHCILVVFFLLCVFRKPKKKKKKKKKKKLGIFCFFF